MSDRTGLEPMLTVEDVAAVTRLSRGTIKKAVRNGDLVAARWGNRLRFRPDALRAWLERAEGGAQ